MAFVLYAERYVRQAHNLKVVGSNPTPATNQDNISSSSSDIKIQSYRTIDSLRYKMALYLERYLNLSTQICLASSILEVCV